MWCASCQSAGIATPTDYACAKCGKPRCPAHVASDPHYVAPSPVDDQTLDLDFGPEPVIS